MVRELLEERLHLVTRAEQRTLRHIAPGAGSELTRYRCQLVTAIAPRANTTLGNRAAATGDSTTGADAKRHRRGKVERRTSASWRRAGAPASISPA